MTNYKKSDSDMNQVGVLFKNISKAGKTYFNGTISNEKVVGFLNSFTSKDGEEMTVINLYEATEAIPAATKKPVKASKKAATDMSKSASPCRRVRKRVHAKWHSMYRNHTPANPHAPYDLRWWTYRIPLHRRPRWPPLH